MGEAIEYATVTLHSIADSAMLDGTVTGENGGFNFPAVSAGSVYLGVQFMGYQPYFSQTIQVSGPVDFGLIGLSFSSATLAEVEISGTAITSLHKLDKQVYDAGQFQNARGGTAADALRNLPSVSINSFGEISVRGATGFLVMINGKPVQSEPSGCFTTTCSQCHR